MRPLVIYHADCTDGYGAAFAAWLKLGDEAEYLPMGYSDKLDPSKVQYEDRDIYILDFSFPREIMNNLFDNARRVVWLDHHKSAFEMWCETEREWYESDDGAIVLNNSKSGAYLAWEYFHPDTEVPMLIQHIDDYDRWQFKLDGTKAFNKALWSYAPWNFKDWQTRYVNKNELWSGAMQGSDLTSYYEQGAAILRAHEQNVQSVVKQARKCRIPHNTIESDTGAKIFDPKTGLAANCPPFLTSDVGHELANQSGTFGLCWTLSQTGLTAKCSLRSNGDYDVSAIARAFGGGGHRNAAGFETDIETLMGWLK